MSLRSGWSRPAAALQCGGVAGGGVGVGVDGVLCFGRHWPLLACCLATGCGPLKARLGEMPPTLILETL